MAEQKTHDQPQPEAPEKKSRKGIGGPKTPEGKKRSSLNAIRHGLLSGAVVLWNEDRDEFAHFRRMYLETFQPVGFLELEILDEMVVYKWRLRRAWAIQTAAVDDEADHMRAKEGKKIEHVDEPTITRRAIRNLEQQGNEFANASRYETRLHRMYYRALNKLQELQDRRAAGKPIGQPVLSDPLPDPPADFPNELEAPPEPSPEIVDRIMQSVAPMYARPAKVLAVSSAGPRSA